MLNDDEDSFPVASGAPSKDFVSNFDFVMVFKTDGVTQSGICKHCFYSMLGADLDLYPYLSIQNDELIILIGAKESKLREFADTINYKLELDRGTLEKVITTGIPNFGINGVNIANDPEKFGDMFKPYSHIFGKYEPENEHFIINHVETDGDGNNVKRYVFGQRAVEAFPAETVDNLYRKHGDSVFSKVDRLKLLFYILEGNKSKGGCGLSISKFVTQNTIEAFYPIHDHNIIDPVVEKCTSWTLCPWLFPFDDIRNYFGERFTLYFVFVGHFCRYLVIPALVGLTFQLVVWGTLDYSHPVLPFFGLIMSIWAIVYLENWKRKENTTALRWGMTDFEQEEPDRPEFNGEPVTSYIDGSTMLYFNNQTRNGRLVLSACVVGLFVLTIVAVVAGIYVMRFTLQGKYGPYASTIASVLNAVQIQVFNFIYDKFAVRTTLYENHRTDTEYEDSMISKTFVFQFVNSYSSFFFIAFIAGNLARPDTLDDIGPQADFQGQCGYANCMQPLSVNLAIIFGSRLVINNVLSIVVPYIMLKLKIRSETQNADASTISRAEKDYMLSEYIIQTQDLQRMADVVIEYGYMILFIVALPISCCLSMINSFAKVKFSMWRHVHLLQRPVPKGAQDIGTWQSILTILSVVGVTTNAALICFTMDIISNYTLAGRLWIFIGFQWVIIAMQGFVSYIIPDVSEKVEVQLQRQEFMISKVILHVPDEDEEEGDEEESNAKTEEEKLIAKRSMSITKYSKGKLEKKYATYPNITPASHPNASSESVDQLLTHVLHGQEARKQILPPKPEGITSTEELVARYKTLAPSSASSQVTPVPVVASAAPVDQGTSVNDIKLKTGADSDDEATFKTA